MKRPPWPKTRGQAFVEFALVLPVVLLMLFASVDFGRAYFGAVGLNQAAREGARYIVGSVGDLAPSQTMATQRVLDTIGPSSTVEQSAGGALSAADAATTTDVTITIKDPSGNARAYTSRASGDSVFVSVKGFVPFWTGFLASGFSYVPGICQARNASNQCGMYVYGQAVAIVI